MLTLCLNVIGVGLANNSTPSSDPGCELHVFVHGSIAPFNALLSYPFVKKDTIKGTAYLAMHRVMNESIFKGPSSVGVKRGFFEIKQEEEFLLNPNYSIGLGAYDAIRREVAPGSSNQHRYFVFGWGGLLSQHERRREAICLYNELAALTAQVKAQGIEPVIKMYTHSHGCNVGLNLALVDACTFDLKAMPANVEIDVVKDMQKLLAGEATADLHILTGKMHAQAMQHSYVKPVLRLEKIDYFTMLCLPAQPETAPLVMSQLFGQVLQIYSENDGIVLSDTLSSRKKSIGVIDPSIIQGKPSVKIVRWMTNRTPLDFCAQCEEQKNQVAKKSYYDAFKDLSPARMKRFGNGGGNPDCHHSEDPTHNDFFGVGMKHEGLFFEQIPLYVFMPLVHKLMPIAGDAQYLDFCLFERDEYAQGYLFDSTDAEHSLLCAMDELSLKPVQMARAAMQHVVKKSKKLKIDLKFNLSDFAINFMQKPTEKQA